MRAALLVHEDPVEAVKMLDIARLLMPGTLVEADATSKGASNAQKGGDGAFTAIIRLLSNGGAGKGAAQTAGGETASSEESSQMPSTSVLAPLLGTKGEGEDGKTATSEAGADAGTDIGEDGDASSQDGAEPLAKGQWATTATQAMSTVVDLATRLSFAVQGKTATAGEAGASRASSQGQGQNDANAQAGVDGEMSSDGELDTLFSRFCVKAEAVDLNAKSMETSSGSSSRISAESIDVVRQETHFAPSMRIPPIQQVGEAVTKPLGIMPGTQTGAAANLLESTMAGTQTSGPMVKILEIKLQPEELGTVRVTMRMVDDMLQVDVRSANQQTVEMLQKGKHMLDRMLQAAGCKADNVTIQAMGDDRSPFQVTAASNAQNAGQMSWQNGGRGEGQPGGATTNGNGDGGSGAGEGGSAGHGDHLTDKSAHGTDEPSRDRRSLYL
ncbi:flagellar hook-length control protein FliK [Breoghania sp.]|uniref:flagellar hook-length control protein FliK n=1 Tax=Breoghania sp. TaxID=2065378 RepID=UPI002606B455|nr:flagellar hook-length control protein FliK [Breoghania sp.]MDJ0929507.1 flagellar hook-length control protein FliK [Breoghania sp.]